MRLIDAEHLKRWLTTRWLESDPTSDKPIKIADILDQIDYGEFSMDHERLIEELEKKLYEYIDPFEVPGALKACYDTMEAFYDAMERFTKGE